MAICLPKKSRDKLLNALKSKDISMEKLYKMTSEERNLILKQYVGKDFSTYVNGKFEQAMVSKQKKAMVNWVEQVTQPKDPVRRDMLKKVNKIEKVLSPDEEFGFLDDLAELKLGLNVTEEEARTILKMKEQIDILKTKIPEGAPARSEERLAYGYALDDFKQFVGALKNEALNLTIKERFLPKNYWDNIVEVASITKALVATLDNSFIGRQGIKTLLRGDYGIWAKSFVESFKNFGKELVAKSPKFFAQRDDAVLKAIRADIYSRPNSLNGKYKAAKNGYGLGVLHEEVFPSSIPERIPLLGRVFKASETAFNGTALRMRADLADAIIANAEKNGVDMLDEAQATGFGRLVTSMTGRGEIGKLGAVGKELNALMFSVRFLKSNIDTVTAHLFDKTMTPQAKRKAAVSTLRIAMSITGLLTAAKLVNNDSVDFDPRSSKFGKICVGSHCYDVTGGMNGLVVLGSRLVPTYHNGEWGFWTKSATTGKYTRQTGDTFGERTALDTLESFFEGKLSPSFGALRDIWKGQKFGGEKPNFVNTTVGLITPISAEMLTEELQKGNDDILFAMIAEGLGISPTSYTLGGYGKKWNELRETQGTADFNKALKEVTENFNERADKLRKSSIWKKLDNDERTNRLNQIKREETERVLRRYGIR